MASVHDSLEWYAPPAEARRVEAPKPAEVALHHAGFCHDPDAAVAGLHPTPGARILVVDAYGGADTALALLATAPAAVRVAALVDQRGVEALLALKSAAVACLDRLDALRLLGLLRASRTERIEAYLGVREALTLPVRGFWDARRSCVAGGLYSTSAEAELGRLLRNLLWNNLPHDAYRTVLYGSREDRLAAFDERIAGSAFWRSALRLCAVRGSVARPGDRAVDAFTADDPVAALRRMVDVGLWASPLWARAFCNDVGVLATLPAYLRPDGYVAVQQHLDRLWPEVDGVDDALEAPTDAPYDKVDLGNLPDHLDTPELVRLLHRAGDRVRVGGAVAFTSFRSAALGMPAPRGFEYDLEREGRCAALDRAPVRGRRRVLRRV